MAETHIVTSLMPGPWNSKRVVVDVNVSFIALGIDQNAFV
jgi:hypothetical protein